ncbi:MAG: Flp pilus assembly protein CpaB [Myxococcota bacterium]
MGSRGGSRRMAIIFLTLSVIAAGLATLILFVVFRSLESRVAERDQARSQELTTIVVAKDTLEQGTTLSEVNLDIKRIPRTFYLDTMVSEPQAIFGRVPRERILAGEPIRKERLANPQAGAGLNALIPKGQRALQVELRGANAVAGFVNPGDYVDILFTGEDRKEKGQHTKTLLQSKLILAVNNRMAVQDDGSRRAQSAPSVTLALTPQEAQVVTHAARTGIVTLTLRNHVDVTEQEVHGVTADKFIGAANTRQTVAEVARPVRATGGGKVVTPQPDPAKDPTQTTIIQGSNVTVVDNIDGEDEKSP